MNSANLFAALAILILIYYLWKMYSKPSLVVNNTTANGTAAKPAANPTANPTADPPASATGVPKVPPKTVRIMYYFMQNCPFCVKFDPEWTKFVAMRPTLAASTGITLTSGKVVNTSPAVPAMVTSFPTITFQSATRGPIIYTGDRTANALAAGVRAFIASQPSLALPVKPAVPASSSGKQTFVSGNFNGNPLDFISPNYVGGVGPKETFSDTQWRRRM